MGVGAFRGRPCNDWMAEGGTGMYTNDPVTPSAPYTGGGAVKVALPPTWLMGYGRRLELFGGPFKESQAAGAPVAEVPVVWAGALAFLSAMLGHACCAWASR